MAVEERRTENEISEADQLNGEWCAESSEG